MGRHARYYDTWVEEVLDLIGLHLMAVWCVLVQPPTRHTPGEGRFPVAVFIPRRPKRASSVMEWPGADDTFAAELREMNKAPSVRPEVRA